MLETLRPCVPLISTSALALVDGLFHSGFSKPFQELEKCGFEKGTLCAWHCDVDGATSNHKVFEDRSALLPKNVLTSELHCSNHRNQRLEVSLQDCAGLDVLSSLYTMAAYFRMGAHWLRMILAVQTPRLTGIFNFVCCFRSFRFWFLSVLIAARLFASVT